VVELFAELRCVGVIIGPEGVLVMKQETKVEIVAAILNLVSGAYVLCE